MLLDERKERLDECRAYQLGSSSLVVRHGMDAIESKVCASAGLARLQQGYEGKLPSSGNESSLKVFEAADAMQSAEERCALMVFNLMIEAHSADAIEYAFKSGTGQRAINSAHLNL